VLYFAPITKFTPERNGSQSWFVIKGVGSIQPSELMKVFTIVILAKIVADHQHKFIEKTVKTDLWLLIKLGTIVGLPVILILKQPDLGTSLVFIAIFLGIVLVSGITWKLLVPIFSSV